MLYIAICEDEQYYLDAIIEAITTWITSNCLEQHIKYTKFFSSEDLLERLENGMHVDLLFLDIQIPNEMNGIELARILRTINQQILIVFVTNYSNYVYEGYGVNALRFIRKPIFYQDIAECLNIAYRRHTSLRNEHFILETKEKHYVLHWTDIICLEARSHYVYFHLTLTTTSPRIRSKLGIVCSRLSSDLFVQCHRSCVVNLSHIRRISRDNIILSNNYTIPVSSKYYSHLLQQFKFFYHEDSHI